MEATKLSKFEERFTTIFRDGVRLASEEGKCLSSRKELAHDLTVELGSAVAAAEFLRDHCSAMLTAYMVDTATDPETDEWKAGKQSILNECSQWRYAITKEGAVFGNWNRPKRAAVISGAAKYEADVTAVDPAKKAGSAGRTKGKETPATTAPVTGSEKQDTVDLKNLDAVLNVLQGIHALPDILSAVIFRLIPEPKHGGRKAREDLAACCAIALVSDNGAVAVKIGTESRKAIEAKAARKASGTK